MELVPGAPAPAAGAEPSALPQRRSPGVLGRTGTVDEQRRRGVAAAARRARLPALGGGGRARAVHHGSTTTRSRSPSAGCTPSIRRAARRRRWGCRRSTPSPRRTGRASRTGACPSARCGAGVSNPKGGDPRWVAGGGRGTIGTRPGARGAVRGWRVNLPTCPRSSARPTSGACRSPMAGGRATRCRSLLGSATGWAPVRPVQGRPIASCSTPTARRTSCCVWRGPSSRRERAVEPLVHGRQRLGWADVSDDGTRIAYAIRGRVERVVVAATDGSSARELAVGAQGARAAVLAGWPHAGVLLEPDRPLRHLDRRGGRERARGPHRRHAHRNRGRPVEPGRLAGGERRGRAAVGGAGRRPGRGPARARRSSC